MSSEPDYPIGKFTDLNRRQLIVPVYLPHFLMSFAFGLSIVTLPLWSGSLVDSVVLTGVMVSVVYIASAIANVPASLLISRIGFDNTAIAGIVTFCIGGLLEALSADYGTLLAGRIVEGIGFSLWIVSRTSYIAAVTPNVKHGRASSLVGANFRLGLVLGTLVAGLLIAEGSAVADLFGETLKVPFYFKVLIALVSLFVFAVARPILGLFVSGMSPKRLRVEALRIETRKMPAAIKETFIQNRKYILVVGIMVFVIQCLRTPREFLVPVVGNSIGIDAATLNFIVSISLAADVTLAFGSGPLMDRLGRKPMAIQFMITAAIACGILFAASFVDQLAVALFVIATIMLGATNGLTSGLVITIGLDLAPRSHPGEFTGIWRVNNDFGAALGPVVSGGIGSLAGSIAAASLALVVAGAAGLLFVWFFVPETLKKLPKGAPPRPS